MVIWAELAASLCDRAAARMLLERLAPFHDQVVIDALGTFGVVSRAVGRLAATLGDTDQACAQFEHALATHERIGADALAARTLVEWGAALAEAGGEGAHRARQLLGAGAEAADRLGITALVRRAATAQLGLDGASSSRERLALNPRALREED